MLFCRVPSTQKSQYFSGKAAALGLCARSGNSSSGPEKYQSFLHNLQEILPFSFFSNTHYYSFSPPPSTEEFPFSLEAQRTVHSPAGVQCCHLNVCLMLTQCLGCKHKGTSSWDQSSQGQVIIDQVLKPQHHP